MKKRMKITAVFASAVILCGNSMKVNAEVLPLRIFAATNDDSIHQMQVLDSKSWIKLYPGSGLFRNLKENTSFYVLTYHLDDLERSHPQYYIWFDPMYLAVPQQDMLQYVLRTDTDQAAAHQQAEEIVQKYFPESRLEPSYPDFAFRRIIVSDKNLRTAERADGLMHELAEAGLISEFYTWGETLQYLDFDHGFLTAYNANGKRSDKENGITYDWAAIKAWVNENHPECELVCITDKDSVLSKRLNIDFWGLWDDTVYAVIPPEETAFADHFALAMELYEQFDLQPCARQSILEHDYWYTVGKNSLAVAGDGNLDCAVDVADAVLTARFAAEDKDAVITDQGRQNADVTHDGNVDDQDALKILQYIAKKNSYADLTE